jgi:hypothetical protein
MGLAWDHAMTTIEAATLMGPSDPVVAAAVVIARPVLERARAEPFLARLDAALGRAAGAAATPAHETRGPAVRAPDGALDASIAPS